MRDEVARSLLSAERSPEGVRARLCFAAELSVFAGHFPGRPIVPGIFLIDAVRLAVERAGGPRRRIVTVDARYRDQVGPGEALELEARVEEFPGGAACRARLVSSRGIAAEIRLQLRDEPD